jgi:site-specific DNA-methyltransferase (adenine-specific)
MELNKIYNENCLSTMQRMANGFVDLTVTSPPYDKLRDYKGFKFPFKHIARHLFRVTKEGGVLVWIVGDQTINGTETGTSFKQALFFMELGFRLHDTMIYKDCGLTMNHNRYEQEFEYMFIFTKRKPKTFNPLKVKCLYYGKDSDRTGQFTQEHNEKGKKLRSNKERTNIKPEKIKGNVWEYPNGFGKSTNDEIAFRHPAIFPDKLVADHIRTWSNEGDIVYDCFGGSGTTAKMAHLLNRKWILSEISGEYCELSAKRLDPYLRQTSLFPISN